MKKFSVNYRNEWGATVEAENEEEAIKKFKEPGTPKGVLSNLWPEMFEVEEIK